MTRAAPGRRAGHPHREPPTRRGMHAGCQRSRRPHPARAHETRRLSDPRRSRSVAPARLHRDRQAPRLPPRRSHQPRPHPKAVGRVQGQPRGTHHQTRPAQEPQARRLCRRTHRPLWPGQGRLLPLHQPHPPLRRSHRAPRPATVVRKPAVPARTAPRRKPSCAKLPATFPIPSGPRPRPKAKPSRSNFSITCNAWRRCTIRMCSTASSPTSGRWA